METQAIDFYPAAEAVANESDSAQSVTPLLRTLCTSKIRAVEELTSAMRSFARFPAAALSFASQAAVEAHHLAMLTGRLHSLAGTIAPNLYDESQDTHAGPTAVGQGGAESVLEFVSHLYMDQHVRLNVLEETARSLESDELTRKIVSRIAKDEHHNLASIRALLDSLSVECPRDDRVRAPGPDGTCKASIC